MNSTTRFSGKVGYYEKFRPTYPEDLLNSLIREGVCKQSSIIADIGSGTGISSDMFLNNGHKVWAVEPNREMRLASEELRGQDENFHPVEGTAEFTTLETGSVNLVYCAQAFHWFDPEPSAVEFARILKPGGNVCLVWNERITDSTPFLKDYEEFLHEYATDYASINHVRDWKPTFRTFFRQGEYKSIGLPNEQVFDREGLRGRSRSCSYMPAPGEDGFERTDDALSLLFEKHQKKGKVIMKYRTIAYWGSPNR